MVSLASFFFCPLCGIRDLCGFHQIEILTLLVATFFHGFEDLVIDMFAEVMQVARLRMTVLVSLTFTFMIL
jgi:hypothetical protein